jgi:hypothetical protein
MDCGDPYWKIMLAGWAKPQAAAYFKFEEGNHEANHIDHRAYPLGRARLVLWTGNQA